MIFRKPYAMLIKYFKIIHIVISIFMIYLVYKTNALHSFFNGYVKSGWTSINATEITNYISSMVYVSIAIILILSIIIFLLMRFKNKPRLYYLLTPIIYVLVLIFFIVSLSILKTAETDVISPITVRALRDVALLAMGIQFIFAIFSVLRAIGFDVKKFNFRQDIADLQIAELDDEEVEVSFEVDKYKLNRKVQRRIRNTSYIFKENKFIIITIIVLLIGGLLGKVLLNKFVFNPVYRENKVVELDKYNIIVNKSYVNEKDYLGNNISNKYKYIVVSISLINRIVDNTFNLDKLSVLVDNISYEPSTNLYIDFIDIGTGYKEQKLSTEKQNNYIFVFKVPKEANTKNTIFRYVTGVTYDKNNNANNKYQRIKLNLIDDSTKTVVNKNLNEQIDINGSKINIKEHSISDSFDYTYKYCISGAECVDSSSRVNVTNSSSTILRLVTDTILSSNIHNEISTEPVYFSKLGSIVYTKGSKTYRQKNLKALNGNTYNDSEIFLQVSNEVANADSISFEFNIRDVRYSYKLK